MSTASLEQFIKKCQTAKSYNSKEIRLTMTEAEELSMAIALLLASTSGLTSRIVSLQEQLLQVKTEIEVSGGGFV